MTAWDYDGSIYRFPVKPGELWSCERGKVMATDLYDGLPEFMRLADCIFTDPPYNAGLENGFRSKAGKAHNKAGFNAFLDMFFERIISIAPRTCFIETGTEWMDRIAARLWGIFPEVEVFSCTYYRKAPCFIVRAGFDQSARDWAGMDEADVIDGICQTETFECIADLCMGRGAVGRAAWAHNRLFVGTELNPARIAVLINHIHQKGGSWHVEGVRFEPQPGGQGAVGAAGPDLQQRLQPEQRSVDGDAAPVHLDQA